MTAQQPLVVAVTGHRDLVAAECDGIRVRVRELFLNLRDKYPDLRLQLLSPLAEGADQLVAEVALGLGVELIVPLPMAVPEYVAGFNHQDDIDRFHELCGRARELFVLTPEYPGMSPDERYAQLGVFLAAHCHLLLAIWDGRDSENLGGTSQVVRFHHDDIMPGYEPKSSVSQQMLVDDESDLVFHVVCSRDREQGSPADDLQPGDWFWFTKDEETPRSKILPPAHDVVFRRANEFSHDTRRLAPQIEDGSWSLLSDAGKELEIDGLEEIDNAFRSADFLAIHYQKKTLRTLRITHVLAFVMGALFVLYSDLMTWQSLLYLFLVCFIVATVVQKLSGARAWHRKYLDYRTLAEGLRVQFHWAMAGITQQDLASYSHDNFLQLQDPEVGWIRNTMRVAGTTNDALPHQEFAALDLVVEEWVGNRNGGQLGYYRRKAADRTRRHRVTEMLGRISLFTSASIVVLFLVAGESIPAPLVDPLMVVMGVTLLLFGVRHAYAHAIAERELIKQYEFMLRIFVNARKRLAQAAGYDQKRQVLMALGSSALDEHAQWILMHRERSVDQAEIWRIGSGS